MLQFIAIQQLQQILKIAFTGNYIMMSNAVVRALTNFQVHFGLMVSDIDQEVEKEVVIK